jgi:aconitate hydratase
VSRLPYSLKILLENLLRREDNGFVKADDIRALAGWNATGKVEKEISFMPARVLLQDFTGVPCVVDLAAMRDAVVALGGDPNRINPLRTVELVIDHSVQVDYFGRTDAFALNAELEFSRKPRALRVPALGPAGVQQLQGRASRHRDRPPGEHRAPRARRVLGDRGR